ARDIINVSEKYPNQKIELPSDYFSDEKIPGTNKTFKQMYEEKHGLGSFDKKFKNSGYSVKQSQNIAKFGNIDSLKADIRTGRVAARGSLLISGAITFGMAKISGAETSDAAKQALKAGIRSYGMTLITTTVTAQLLKTETIRHFVQSEDMIFKFANQKGVKNVLSKATHGEINVNSATPLHGPSNIIKSAMVSSAVTTLILSVPDILNVIQNRESGRQMAVNVATTASSVAAGSVGYYLGAACGSVVPVVGTFIGGMIGASIASSLASNATRGILTEMLGDDSKEMLEIFNSELAKIAQDYLLAEDEINYVVDTLQSNGALSPKRMQDIFAAEDRPKFCQKLITPTVEEVCELRNFIVTPPENQMADYLGEIIEAEFTEIPEESPEDISEESVE
ncbi:MAG: hypothetical protein PUB99_10010, partial [Oscillospiraceae bacterium]|nr:hypothetical protein [Oscillospiraceae bacterium]